MKTLTSKFLAVALLLSAVSPVTTVFAGEPQTPAQQPQTPAQQPQTPKTPWTDSLKTFFTVTLKNGASTAWAPFSKTAEQITESAKSREALLKKESKDLSWTELLFSKPVAQAGKWTEENQTASNWMYRGAVVAALAGLGFGAYKLYNWYFSTKSELQKLEALEKAAKDADKNGNSAKLSDVFYKLYPVEGPYIDGLYSKSTRELEDVVKGFDMTEEEAKAVYQQKGDDVSKVDPKELKLVVDEQMKLAKDAFYKKIAELINAAKEAEKNKAKETEKNKQAEAVQAK